MVVLSGDQPTNDLAEAIMIVAWLFSRNLAFQDWTSLDNGEQICYDIGEKDINIWSFGYSYLHNLQKQDCFRSNL